MNKGMRRTAAALLTVLLLLQGLAVSALAADEPAYYTIRIFAGNVEGAAVAGQSVWTYTGQYGEQIPFDLSMVSLPANSKYSVRGVRESGLDNNQISPLGTITEDADYVIAYGITGHLVSYTVNFVDRAGNALAPSQTYYGNAGDKPVVAYLYVDDYLPQAYNLTRTLSENEADNVFTFIYTQIVRPTPAPTQVPGPTPTPTLVTGGEANAPAAGGGANAPAAGNEANAPAAGGGANAPAAGGGTNAPAAGGGTNAPAAGGGVNAPAAGGGANVPAAGGEANAPAAGGGANAPAAGNEANAPAAEVPEEQTPLDEGPAELIDLDEDDTPLGKAPDEDKTDLQKDREQKQTKFFVSAALLLASLAVIIAAVLLLVKKRGKQP